MKKCSCVRRSRDLSKVTIPLLSISSSGKIADKLIFEKWKNKQRVKEYKKPFNPDTAKQRVQRSYMVPVIEAWHKDGYTPDDKEAWDNYARIIKINATGYNMFTRFKINAQKAANTWVKLINCQISGIYGNGCNVVIDVVSDESGVLFYGSSKVALYKEVAGVYSSGHSTFTIINLEEFTRYYFFILNTSSGEVARTGIYTFRTTTGGPVGLTGHWDQLNNGYDKAVWGVKIFPTGHWDQIGNGYDRATWGTKIYPTGHWDQVGNGYDRATWG